MKFFTIYVTLNIILLYYLDIEKSILNMLLFYKISIIIMKKTKNVF